MPTLASPIATLPGIGPSTVAKLKKLGITTVLDLVSHFPIRHEDLRRITKIGSLHANTTVVLKGRLQLIESRHGYRRRRMNITEGLLTDGTGTVKIVWFNQPYLTSSFKAGDQVFVVGKLSTTEYGPQLQSPLIEKVGQKRLLAGRIVPVYPATAGISQRQLRSFILSALPATRSVPEWIPEPVRRAEHLIPLATALADIHFPTSHTKLAAAVERLKFGELLPFMMAVTSSNLARQSLAARPVPLATELTRSFVESLPFSLTDDQRRAAWDIVNDMAHPSPMRRLLEGDVGSGKTVVAAIAMHAAAQAGFQTLMLAPTDILARQHYETLIRLFGDSYSVALLTGSQAELHGTVHQTKRSLRQAINTGSASITVGTHALLTDTVRPPTLALVVVDEQHRFGVEQRRILQHKTSPMLPHLLSMTATPIPRTLALTLYGTLSVSLLRTLPAGRAQTETRIASTDTDALDTILEHCRNGRQAYVICPLIEESDALGVAAATAEYERLSRGPLAHVRCALLHGKQAAAHKQRILKQFAAGEIDVLISTPVVEVGIDVPNATVMLIEGAERFGLAQLHQLRGRIGRGTHPSVCVALTDSTDARTMQRLDAFQKTTDGFALAETDLTLRGSGDLYGIRQSGLPSFSLVSLGDISLMQRTRTVAEQLLADDPSLRNYPLLRAKIKGSLAAFHGE